MSWNAQGWGSKTNSWGSSDAAGSTTSAFPASGPDKEKFQLMSKLRDMQKSRSDFKSKWWSFCKVHGEGNFELEKHDVAFLQTFWESFEAGTIVDQPDCPFSQAEAAPAVAGGGEKIFIGGLPRSCTEDKVWSHFGQFGTIAKVEFKYDDANSFRGFGFVTFEDKAAAQAVIDNKDNNYLEGKWIDCKLAQTGLQSKGKDGKGGGKDAGAGKGGKASWGGNASKGNDSWEKKDSGWNGDSGNTSWGGNASQGSAPSGGGEDTKIFIGGLPKATTTEDKVTTFFSKYGNVARVDLKYDEMGTLRGFGFVTFSDASSVQAVLSDSNVEFEGKWIDCKAAVGKGKGDKSGGKGGDKGGGKKGGGKTNDWASGGGGGGSSWGGDGGGSGGWNNNNNNSQWGSSGTSGGGDSWGKGYNKW